MELDALKQAWELYDRKLDKSLQLNIQLLKKVNFSKVNNKINTLLIYKIAEVLILLIFSSSLISFIAKNADAWHFIIPALSILFFIILGIVSDIRQISIIIQIRANEAAPVASLQKKVEKLKLLIVNYVKCSLLFIPLYPLLLIPGAKIIWDMDMWAANHRAYLIANIVVGSMLMPVFVWLYFQLSKNNLGQLWVRNFLSGSGWSQANSAQQFLKEIEEFEKEG